MYQMLRLNFMNLHALPKKNWPLSYLSRGKSCILDPIPSCILRDSFEELLPTVMVVMTRDAQ
jgi:hypothetical protein